MGIKFLYSLLKREFPHIFSTQWSGKDVDLLCVDLNNMIHICTQEKYGYGMYAMSLPRQVDLADILKRRIEELLDLYRPRMMYIATDGIPSSAKLFQQRQRRFRPASNDTFDSNMISPGTSFMRELESNLRHAIRLWKRKRRMDIVYSTDLDEGEGEMKLFRYIKDNMNSIKGSVVVYGQDADIMLLSLVLKHKHAFNHGLFIHRPHSKDRDAWEVVDIDLFHELLHFVSDPHFECFIRSMCFIGNHFLPSLHTMNLLKDLNEHKDTMHTLMDHIRSMSMTFMHFKDVFVNLLRAFDPMEDAYIRQYWVTDNSDEMRTDYYTRKVGGVEHVQVMCTQYFNMMKWVEDYYVHFQVPDWDYVYPYLYAPFIKDLLRHASLYREPTWVTTTNPTSIHEQWARIMPVRTLAKLVPETMIDDIVKAFNPMFPETVELDMEHKDIDWEAVIRVPFFPRSDLLSSIIHTHINKQ